MVLIFARGRVDPGMRTEGIDELKISKGPIGNRIRNLPPCGAVPQETAPPLAPCGRKTYINCVCVCVCVCVYIRLDTTIFNNK